MFSCQRFSNSGDITLTSNIANQNIEIIRNDYAFLGIGGLSFVISLNSPNFNLKWSVNELTCVMLLVMTLLCCDVSSSLVL